MVIVIPAASKTFSAPIQTSFATEFAEKMHLDHRYLAISKSIAGGIVPGFSRSPKFWPITGSREGVKKSQK